jgi:SM-20-related protein
LLSEGVAVGDGFVNASRVRALAECAERRRSRGDFTAACIGAVPHRQRREAIRGDHICWLSEPLFDAERALLHDLEQFRLQLNQAAFLGLFDLELHYAWYPAGAGYGRHVDQPQGRSQRQVSLVLYLNETWHRGAGGELRLFEPDGGHRDLEPLAGRLVCFLSAGREHAVLPTRQDRLSLAGWFRRRD